MEDIVAVATDKKGLKRICMSCGTRFYDFNNRPVMCPNCNAEFTGEVKSRGRKAKSPAANDDATKKNEKDVDQEAVNKENEENEESEELEDQEDDLEEDLNLDDDNLDDLDDDIEDDDLDDDIDIDDDLGDLDDIEPDADLDDDLDDDIDLDKEK